MDADVDSDWISTQAVVSTDIQPDNEQEKINDYGCIVLNGMIDDGRYVLKEGNNTIGRHPLNDIYIEHPSVSMNHAVIQCDSDGVVLLDKGSLNKTKLNKKNLRKDVAYFLEENSLLMFGEVQANYFINGESNEFINNTKSIASNNTSIHKETQNYGLSLSTLSNTINVSESLRTDIPNAITDCNVPSIIENSSTCMIEKAVPQTITRSECPVNTFDDIHEELISPSPSDEYLLEALSQIETMQNNIDSNKIFQNLSNKDTLTINTTESMPKVTREDTPSPVMDLKNSILTINNKTKSLCQSPNKINIEATREDTPSPVMDLGSSFITTNNISGSIFQSSDKINTELIREDTPSPTMDLENSFETTNNIPGRIFQTPNKINTELIREDTPSPIMDFGCYNDSENKIETNNPGIVSAIQSPNKDDELNNTQVLEISNFKSENTSISINQSLIQKQNLSMNNLFCKSQKVESGDQSNLTTTNVFDNHSNANLSCSNNINSNKKSSVKPAEHLNGIHNDGLHNDSEQNRSILTIPNLKSDTEGNNTNNYNINFNTFEADDDDIFSNFIENESKSQNQNLNVLENQDIFNSPTQKVSTDININLKSNVSNEIHKEKTQEILEFPKSGKDNSSLSTNNSTNIHEELTPIPEMDDDFFNCPTQKYAFPKKKNEKPKKTSSSIHEEETQRPSELVQFNKIKTSNSNIDTEVLEIDNEDFFNCQTQKLSITKNRNPKPKVSSTIHEEETQVHEMHDDFFNCPTQKYAYPKKINENQKISSLIHEEETQNIFEFSKPNKNNLTVSKDNSTSIHEEETQVPELDDDFYNCPTQKLSIPKKINEKPKTSTSIHEEETQRPSELVQFNKTETSSSNTEINVLKIDNEDFFDCPTQKLSISKNTNPKPKVSSTIHEEETQVPKMHDDFFNCPTQKYAYPKKINEKPKISSSIHEEETQRPSELVKFNKTKTGTSNTKTDMFIIDNEDFFDCPTQKLSITKNTNQKPKVSSTIHEKETQNIFEFSKPNKNNLTVSKDNSTSIHEEETQVPELDDDFYNCPTQKLSIPKKIHQSSNVATIANKENSQNPPEFSKLNKINTNISQTDSTNKHKNFDECTLNNHKITVEHDNENTDKVKKSKCVNSNIIRLSNVQLPAMCKENSSNSLKMDKPKIRVREDLCISYSSNSSNSSNSTVILNKPIERNTVMNNINTSVSLNENLNSPSCSKSPTDRENVLNMLSSIKQEHFSDDSAQSRVSISNKSNDRLKRMDESIFSPFNIPDISADSLSKHHSSSKTVEDNLNSLNCEPSTSNNDASIWKSFWNKKKVQCQVKGKSDKQNNITHEVKENKERYQTRAITRKEIASKLNKKRKQDGDEESNKKICTRNKILEPLVENSSEIVVSFSYLKSRHLQEMKQFVDKTGGSVTDEITQCTVLVTDKIRCTMKILSAIARGCPIVNANWLKHSYTVKMFQDANDFLIVDKDAERKYQFKLKESLAKAKTKKLLDGYNVLVTPSVKPGPQEMKVIIACAGGNYVLNWTDTQCTKELIVTCDKDRNRWKPAWDNDFAKIIDSDTLVTSIIRQKLTI